MNVTSDQNEAEVSGVFSDQKSQVLNFDSSAQQTGNLCANDGSFSSAHL